MRILPAALAEVCAAETAQAVHDTRVCPEAYAHACRLQRNSSPENVTVTIALGCAPNPALSLHRFQLRFLFLLLPCPGLASLSLPCPSAHGSSWGIAKTPVTRIPLLTSGEIAT